MEKEFDFIHALRDALADEAADVEKYMEMAEEACKHPEFQKYAPILRDISKEESVHHKHLAVMLRELCAGNQEAVAGESEKSEEDE